MRFRSTILTAGKTATGIPVPDEVIAGLNSGKRPAISVTINDYTYRTTIGSVDGRPMIPLSAENRAGAGVAGGDEVEVEIALNTAPREVSLPADFAAALEHDAAAKRTSTGYPTACETTTCSRSRARRRRRRASGASRSPSLHCTKASHAELASQ